MFLLFRVAHLSEENSPVSQSAAAPGVHVTEIKGVNRDAALKALKPVELCLACCCCSWAVGNGEVPTPTLSLALELLLQGNMRMGREL